MIRNSKFLTKAVILMLITALILPTIAFANFPHGTLRGDGFIVTDPVDNTYTGRPQASRLINQIQFTDLPSDARTQDAIIRGAALEIFRPDTRQFRPNALVTNEEAIVYALRAAGLSEQARTTGQTELDRLPQGSPLGMVWSFGYLHLAQNIGMISDAELNEAITGALVTQDDAPPGGALVDLQPTFDRTAPAAREDIAFWLVSALENAQQDIFAGTAAGLGIQNFTDWNDITPSRAPAIETLMRHRIMSGQSDTVFAPQGNVSRQHYALLIRNLDRLLYGFMDLERHTGTVAQLGDEQFNATNTAQMWRNIWVRREDGQVDQLIFGTTETSSPQDGPLDAIVLRNGEVGGLNILQEGDIIEYLVHPEDGTVWYVQVTGGAELQVFRSRLQRINIEDRTVTFMEGFLEVFTFQVAQGLFGYDDNGQPFIRISNQLFPLDRIPMGSLFDIYLVGNIVTDLIFVGDDVIVPEIRGIVIDNNPFLGSITILDENRFERSFSYIPGHLRVQRREFFDDRSVIGGIHQMFPSPNHRDAEMEDVIAGDIVVFRVAEDDPNRIIAISAAENTSTRYGRIAQFRDHGGHFDMLMEFGNGQTAWFTLIDGVLVLQDGRPTNANQIQLGDWARVVVNQAVIAPGVMIESVREIALDGGGHHINEIVMGTLSGFNASQNQLTIRNAQTLGAAGWSNHRQLDNFNIGGNNVEYFFDGRQVTLAYMNRHLQRSDATVYLVTENNFAGERVRMVSVRSGRNELLQPDTVLAAANNRLTLLENDAQVVTDAGTITVRNGRLVDHSHVFPADWARVSLNGLNTAAVVDIGMAPATSGVQIARGRVSQVWPHQSFRVSTMSIFDGLNWNFTPINREFTIDHDTLFLNESGVGSINNFIHYGDNSVIAPSNNVYTVVIDGGRVSRVIDAPFTEPIPQIATAPGHLTVRGIITGFGGGGGGDDDDEEGGGGNVSTVQLRDVMVFNGRTGQWSVISNTNATASVTLHPNTIIVDRDQIISGRNLRVGQQIKALSNQQRPATITPGFSADVYIVLVES